MLIICWYSSTKYCTKKHTTYDVYKFFSYKDPQLWPSNFIRVPLYSRHDLVENFRWIGCAVSSIHLHNKLGKAVPCTESFDALYYSPVFTLCFPHAHTPVCCLLGFDRYALQSVVGSASLHGGNKMTDSLPI